MSIPFTDSRWKSISVQSPEDVQCSEQTLHLRARENTDWWKSAVGSVPEDDVERHDGPLYVFELEDQVQFWTASVWIAVEHNERFQQATLFIGQNLSTSEKYWLKAGIEIEHDKQNIGSVVASPISDWALFSSPEKVSQKPGGNWLYVEAKRTGADVILSYFIGSPPSNNHALQRPNHDQIHLMREVKGFAKHFQTPWHIGVMTCGPKSKETNSTFHSFTFTKDA